MKEFLYSKGNSYQTQEIAHKWEKIFASYSFDKGLIFRIYRELKESQPPKNQQPNEETGT
jgi:hypothetical protein